MQVVNACHSSSNLSSLLQGLHTKLAAEISSGDLQLPSHSRHFHLQDSPGRGRHQQRQARSSPLFKSRFSPEEQREVRRLREEMARFEESLERKNREAIQLERELKEQKAREESNRQKAECERHREAVLVRKQQRWLQRREEELLASHSRPPPARLLYQQLEQHRQAQEERQERERAELLSVLSQQRRGLVNISRLNEHEQSYLRKVRQQKAERTRRVEQARTAAKQMEHSEATTNATLKSKFYQRVIAEAGQQKIAIQEAERERQRSQQRLKEFVSRVRSESELIQQRRPLRSTTHSKQQKSSAQLRPNLTQMQLHQLGNRFLRESLLRVAKQQKRSIATEAQEPTHEKHNYLQELRQQRTTQGSSRSFSLLHEGKIERILVSPLPREEKVERLKRLAHRLQAGPPSSDAQEELAKIHTKMKILQATLRARE